jgi:large conductance mechanosensitive channel
MLKEFRQFILRGNVVDLAVAVVIGAAFSGIVTSLTKDFIYPLIGAIYNTKQFSTGVFVFRNQKFMYGDFVNAILSFLIVASVVFFLVVQPINRLIAFSNRNQKPIEPNTKKCPECLSEVPKPATRCSFCTIKLAVGPATTD